MREIFTRSILRCLVGALCCLVMSDCQEEEISPSEIEFSLSLQNVVEGESATILLTLDQPARQQGSVFLNIETNAIYNRHYETDPAVVNGSLVVYLKEGQQSAEINITTIDNSIYEGTRFIIFQMEKPSDGFQLGATTTLAFTIGDDEGPSSANFALSSENLIESDEEGVVIQIPLSTPAKGDGGVKVTLEPGQAQFGTHFTIDQALRDNSFVLNFSEGATGISFKIFPVNNELFTGNFILSFSLAEFSGVAQKGGNLMYALTLVDDEAPSIAKFALPTGTVDETSGDGFAVGIELSSPVKGQGQIEILIASGEAVYGIDFTTVPEAINNTITLSLTQDQYTSGFTVFPVNDDVVTENLTQSFSIANTSGVVWKGSAGLTFELTIVDDEEPTIANFAGPGATVVENNPDGLLVEIQFSYPATETGKITVDVLGDAVSFTSDPAVNLLTGLITLDVAQGAGGVNFTIFPKDNSLCNGVVQTTFIIANAGAIKKGDNVVFILTITDDDEPVIVTLNEKEGILNENTASGKEIILNFSRAPGVEGVIYAGLDYYSNYPARYTTVPSMEYESGYGYYATLSFKSDDRSILFKVLPLNDDVIKGNFIEPFYFGMWGSPFDCVQVQDDPYKLTFVDDD